MQEWNKDMTGISLMQTFVIRISMGYDISKYLSKVKKRYDKDIQDINFFIYNMNVISLS